MSPQLHEDDDTPAPRAIDWGLWRRVFAHARPYRVAGVVMVTTGMVVAAADVGLPLVTARLIDRAAAGEPLSDLWALGLAYLGCLGLIAAAVWAFIAAAGVISTGVGHDLRREGFRKLQQLPFAFYDTRPIGWLVARLTADCGKVSGLLPWLLLDAVWGGCLLLGIAGAMLWLDSTLALWVLAIVPPLAITSVMFQQLLLESSRQVRRMNARITGSFNEAIIGVRTTKALAREGANLGEFQDLSAEMYRYSMHNALQSAVYLPLVVALGSAGLGLALWRGGLDVGHGLTVGTLIAFMQFATLFSMPIRELARTFSLMQAAQAAAERVQGLLDETPAIVDPPNPLPLPDASMGDIQFDNVTFSYKEGEVVLDGCSFVAHPGETVALVGPTGGGKSTIVKLLARYYDVNSGAVRIGGTDIRQVGLERLQSRFGVVLQDPHLFSGTLRENIRYGRLDASDDEVVAAAELVHAHRFISRLPDGYDTEVGEGGCKLSTGERQLVSLARALLADPQIIVMDEATSSVDTATEQAIQAGVEATLRGRIAFVIAHRLSTIRNAHRILVVQSGAIVEQGTHRALLDHRGEYWRLHQH